MLFKSTQVPHIALHYFPVHLTFLNQLLMSMQHRHPVSGQETPVSDAIVSAMQYCPLRTLLHICNRVRGYAKTVRRTCTCSTVHVCARVKARSHFSDNENDHDAKRTHSILRGANATNTMRSLCVV